ncbi:MAG: zinc ribbon domain-containing protein [Candidatus Thorarchaeota archaeon SMTZ1-45]
MKGRGRRPLRSPRRIFRPFQRRRKARIIRGLFRISTGAAMLYLIAGTNRAVKLDKSDVRKLESDAQKNVEDMDEHELIEAMERLGIKSISLTNEEKQLVLVVCPYCGHKNEQSMRKCENCGASI